MMAADTNPGQETRAARAHPARRRAWPGAAGHVASLKAQLAITEDQLRLWAEFAATLSANNRRMQRAGDADHPFGLVEDRLAALGSMRHAAAELIAVLRSDQRHGAFQLLPLCCLPPSAWL